MRSDVGKIMQKRILDVKLKVPQKREGELCGGVLKKGVKTRYIITNTSYIISNTSISSNNSSQKKLVNFNSTNPSLVYQRRNYSWVNIFSVA